MNLAQANLLRLDIKCFKAFLAVAEYKNFTLAADKAAMTQSVVSQHIAKLEDQIGHPLFVRTGKQALLTEAGEHVLHFVQNLMDNVSDLFGEINKDQEAIEGLVRYAMPPSCILSPHFPMLLERRLDFPELELKVELTPNEDVFDAVISTRYDFGFVTERIESPYLEYRPFCEEEYIAVSANKTQIDTLSEDNLLEQKYISYPGMNTYVNFWLRHCFPERHNITDRSLHHAGEINTIEGAILMVRGGLGLSVFPRHCVQAYIESGELFEYQRAGLEPLLNAIYIVTLKTETMPKRMETVIQWFLDMHPEYQQEQPAT